ncbi:beta-propeller domain-containing protein [Bacillaceae bacterium IKA-2]|nr:beta-propeller domain-containing protein [Bacillaceae bacterium IKA-2]
MKKVYLLTSFIIFAVLIFSVAISNQQSSNETPIIENDLPFVGTAKNFEKLLKDMNQRENNFAMRTEVSMDMAVESSKDAVSSSGSDHSSTNVQVEGVDEADSVKNDGDFIYQLRDNQLIISKVNPPTEMKVVYKEDFDHNEFFPREMYLDDQHLVLIGARPLYDQKNYYHQEFTSIKVYDLNDRSNLTLVREAEVEGYYSSSRKINDALYIVTNKHLPYYLLDEIQNKVDRETFIDEMKPSYRDSAFSEELKMVDWDEVNYFPGSPESNYLIVSALDLADLDKPISVNPYLGAGNTIYASQEHLYVTRTHYEYEGNFWNTKEIMIAPTATKQETFIYKFKLNEGDVTFLTEASVKGALLNQFSMDEHNGYFRIATTFGDMWSETNPSENLLFVLDENLKVSGSITGIAKGERIFSARFLGDRGYIVTFKQVDPLFVLDLKDPTNPTILGELKIPGFSDYLHPYDENHIIGFGKDTTENNRGGVMVEGFKMALFDITDVNNPKEKFVEIIGDSGTHSELLYNHKALLFSKEKNIIAFPIEVYENNDNQTNNEINNSSIPSDRMMMYPSFSFQGAYVYGLDLDNGFKLQTRISHYDKKPDQSSEYYYDYQKHISRMIYIEENLYTLSNYKIEAHDLNNFTKKAELVFTK